MHNTVIASSKKPAPLLESLRTILASFQITLPNTLKLTIKHGHMTNDSRAIKSGDIFCAIIGHAEDGRHYITQAIKNGASVILSECEHQAQHGTLDCSTVNTDVAVINFYQLNTQLFSLASAYYQAPEKKMTMIGITGTNGKTSTSQLLGQLLTACHFKSAVIGTNGAGIVASNSAISLKELANTTPSATDLQQFFYDFSRQQVSHVAMEVSSHALEQGRVSGNIFDIAMFTNLSRDHLDYHGSMAAYASAKKQLFTHDNKQMAVLNADDKQAQLWLKDWQNPENLWLYGRNKQLTTYARFVKAEAIIHHSNGVTFTLNSHLGDIEINSPLLGDFNIDNLLAVISVLLIQGVSLDEIAKQVVSIQAINGRMEKFSALKPLDKSVTAVVDYAHTPDALEKALFACRQHCHGQLHVVFGCGGDRDKGKRALMAQAAENYADCIVVTSDNPRTEAPMSIIEDILSGLIHPEKAVVVENRKQAVLETLAQAADEDVVLLAGKGHEDYIIIGKEKIDYNERLVVIDFFKHYQKKSITTSAGEQ